MNTQRKIGESLEVLWRDLTFLADLASIAFPSCPVVHGKQNGGTPERREVTIGWQSILEKLVDRIAAITTANEVRAYMSFLGREHRAIRPPRIRDLDIRPPTVVVSERTRLAFPIFGSSQWVGYFDLRNPEAGEFTTQDKKLLKATVSLLGLAADRAALMDLQQRFASHVTQDHKIQSMLHRVWALTNNGAGDFARTLDSVISAVRRTVPCEALITRLWDCHGQELYEFQDAANPEILALVQDAVDQASGQTLSSEAVWARRYPAEQDDLGGREGSGESAGFLGAVMIVPLRRLHSGRGVMALARDGESPEFATEEKQALCIVSGLLNGLNGD